MEREKDRQTQREIRRDRQRQRQRNREARGGGDRHGARGRRTPDAECWAPRVEVKGGPGQAGEPRARLER